MHFTATTNDAPGVPEAHQPTPPSSNGADVPTRQRYGICRPFHPVPGLSDKARANGEMVVAGLWVAHRAARRLRRQIRSRVQDLAQKAGTAECPCCGGDENDDGDGCDLCVLGAYLQEVLRPEMPAVSAGEAADCIRLFLPHFDVRFYAEQIEKCVLGLRNRDSIGLG